MNIRVRTLLLNILASAPRMAAYAPIGGQAVIEGVMIRSPRKVATAVLRTSGEISLKQDPFLSVLQRSSLFRLPIIRGGLGLVESMVIGMKALAHSAELVAADEKAAEEREKEPAAAEPGEGRAGASGVAKIAVPAGAPGGKADPAGGAARAPKGGSTLDDAPPAERPDPIGRWSIAGTLVLSLGLGIFFFFYVPLLLTEWTGVRHSVLFNLIDGLIRLVFLVAYLKAISLWSEMRRVFEFHGAEHKAIHNFESGQPLSPETAATFTRLHPRCGTAFLLTVMITSIVVFTFFGRPDTIGERLIRMSGIPLIGGLAYEAIRFSGRNWDRGWVRFLAAPGLKLQLLTTREPDLTQLEVAIRAVEAVTPLEASDMGEIRVM